MHSRFFCRFYFLLSPLYSLAACYCTQLRTKLPPADERDNFQLVVIAKGGQAKLASRHQALVEFHSHAARLQRQLLQQLGEIRAIRHRLRLSIDHNLHISLFSRQGAQSR